MPAEHGPRTYGNWRRARRLGGEALGGGGRTTALLLAVIIPGLALYLSARLALALVPVSAALAVAVLARIEGQSLADVLVRRVRFARARSAGWTELSGGMLTDHPRRVDLPGPMAMVVPLSTDDGRGGKQGLLWDRRTGWLTVVMRVSPFGLDLADGEQADEWVAGFGGFLAALGRQPIVRHIAVTVDTAPSGGTAMRDHIVARIDPGSPDAAREVMRELADAASTCCADVDTRLSITFDPARAHPRPTDLMAGVAEVTRSLPGLEASLAKSGVAVLGRASLTWLIGRLRTAYDPSSRGEVGRVDDGPGCEEILLWEEAGPLRATETWELWRHDSGVSVSWALSEAPRQPVLARVLAPLVAPGPFPRRITLFYEPLPAGVAADEVDRQSAEAAGAGVATFTLYVTTTVLTCDEDLLDAATADLEQRAGQCRLRLRRLRGAQQAGFAAALGLGIDPIELARRGHR